MNQSAIVIPEMTDPLGKHWEQPKKDQIYITRLNQVVMSKQAFYKLQPCSSNPPGVFVGQMWKTVISGSWHLSIYFREITKRFKGKEKTYMDIYRLPIVLLVSQKTIKLRILTFHDNGHSKLVEDIDTRMQYFIHWQYQFNLRTGVAKPAEPWVFDKDPKHTNAKRLDIPFQIVECRNPPLKRPKDFK